MKIKIITIFLCLVLFNSCKDDEPTIIYGEGEIEYNTDSPDYYPGYPEIVELYGENLIYHNLIQTIIDKEGAKMDEITILEIKLKSGVLHPDGLSEEEFMKLESGSFKIIERVGSGMNSSWNFYEIGILDLNNSSKTELIFQSNDFNFLYYLDVSGSGRWASLKNEFEFNSSNEPELDFSYFQNIYEYKYKIEK